MGRIISILQIAYFIFRITLCLLSSWISIKWKVRRARKAFEEEAVKHGISREEAQRLSEVFTALEGQLKDAVRASLGF